MDVAVLFGVALAIGVIAAVAIRLLHLRWTWALCGLTFVAAALAMSAKAVTGALVATTVSVACGLAWHRQDLERGGVEGQRARDRRGPLVSVRGGRARKHWESQRVSKGRLALGTTANGLVRTVPFGANQGTRAFVIGAPGSGKTVTLAAHARAYAEAGLPVICVDPKGDASLRSALEDSADSFGKPFLSWSPQGPVSYNPLGQGSASEIADKALAGETWSEPHYLRQAQRYLGLELQALRACELWPPSLASVVRYLDPSRLDQVLDGADESFAAHTRNYLEGLSSRQRADLGGVRDRLAILSESELGPWLEPEGGASAICLGEAMKSGSVVYFQLDADRFPLASQMLGAAIVVDLVSLTGQLQGQPLSGLVLIDEFAAVASEEVSRLLSRSRSAGLSVVLATQAFADLSIARPGDSTESLRRQVLSHVDYLIAHRQSEPEAAELLGQMAGTRPAWSVATRVGKGLDPWDRDEQLTRRRTREFVCHPDEFKRLAVGEAIVIEPMKKEGAQRVRIWDRRAGGNEGGTGSREPIHG